MTIKAKEQHSKQKGKSIIENPEIQATNLWIVYY
jgi:hypothetical protein